MRALRSVAISAGLAATMFGAHEGWAQARQSKPGESSASLQETQTWLKDQLIANGGWTNADRTVVTYRPLEFASCTVSVADQGPDGVGKVTVPLGDLDPNQIKAEQAPVGEEFAVLLRTKAGRESIRMEQASHRIYMLSGSNLIFRDRSIADRVAVAIAHAATLCAKQPF